MNILYIQLIVFKIKELRNNKDELRLLDDSLKAYIKYYNENVSSYNVFIRKFPYNLIGIILKYKEKKFFDNKDLNDDNINDFKL